MSFRPSRTWDRTERAQVSINRRERLKRYLLPETLPDAAPSCPCQPHSKQCQVLREVSLSGNYLLPNYSDYDSITYSTCLWAGMWTGRRATSLPSGIIKVSGNTTENDSYKYLFHEIKLEQRGPAQKAQTRLWARREATCETLWSGDLFGSAVVGSQSHYWKCSNSAFPMKCLLKRIQLGCYIRIFFFFS